MTRIHAISFALVLILSSASSASIHNDYMRSKDVGSLTPEDGKTQGKTTKKVKVGALQTDSCVTQNFACSPFRLPMCGSTPAIKPSDLVSHHKCMSKATSAEGCMATGIGLPASVAKGTTMITKKIMPHKMKELIKLPFALFGPKKTAANQKEIEAFVNQTINAVQTYVQSSIAAQELQNLYNGIMGDKLLFEQVDNFYDGGNGDYQQVNNALTSLTGRMIAQYPQYAKPSPWLQPSQNSSTQHGSPAPNGYGMYFSVYVTLMMNAFSQAIAYNLEQTPPDWPTIQTYQRDIVDLAWKAMPQAKQYLNSYAQYRSSSMNGPTYSCDAGSNCNVNGGGVLVNGGETNKCQGSYKTNGCPYVYGGDDFSYFVGASASPTQCDWAYATALFTESGYGSLQYSSCPDEDAVNLATNLSSKCQMARDTLVMTNLYQNWDIWLMQPAEQWAALADEICAHTNETNLLNMCSQCGNPNTASAHNNAAANCQASGVPANTSATEYMARAKSDPSVTIYKAQAMCQEMYPNAFVVAVDLPTTSSCNEYFYSTASTTYVEPAKWLAQLPAYACCLRSDQTPYCPNEWSLVTTPPESSDPSDPSWLTSYSVNDATMLADEGGTQQQCFELCQQGGYQSCAWQCNGCYGSNGPPSARSQESFDSCFQYATTMGNPAAEYSANCDSSVECCMAPPSYDGPCDVYANFTGQPYSTKEAWAANCGAAWTVYSNSPSPPPLPPSPPPTTMCTCSNANQGTAGKNGFTCDDSSYNAYCSSDAYCYSYYSWPYKEFVCPESDPNCNGMPCGPANGNGPTNGVSQCECATPCDGTKKHNQFRCTDGTSGWCANNEDCIAHQTFTAGDGCGDYLQCP